MGLPDLPQAKEVAVKLQVKDMRHARSEEVLAFCLEELKSGTTYNDLRLMLGLGPASIDRRWRRIREILVELILPDTEEEALRADAGMSGYLIHQAEKFMKKVQARAQANAGEETEAQFMKLELDALKLIMEKYSKRTDHFLKMKDLQKKEKRTTGPTIIFNNLHRIARPGDLDVTPGEAGKLIVEAEKVDDPD